MTRKAVINQAEQRWSLSSLARGVALSAGSSCGLRVRLW